MASRLHSDPKATVWTCPVGCLKTFTRPSSLNHHLQTSQICSKRSTQLLQAFAESQSALANNFDEEDDDSEYDDPDSDEDAQGFMDVDDNDHDSDVQRDEDDEDGEGYDEDDDMDIDFQGLDHIHYSNPLMPIIDYEPSTAGGVEMEDVNPIQTGTPGQAVNQVEPAIGEPGPGPSTAANRLLRHAHAHALDDNEDTRHRVEHSTAGKTLRKVEPPTLQYEALPTKPGKAAPQNATADQNQVKSPYYPFVSLIDWKIAHWAIKAGPGQNNLDLLLSIPTVVERLGLSFHNSRALHKIFDGITPKAGPWTTKVLKFEDDPKATFTVHHRDAVRAIEALWRDPLLSPQMKFAPVKVFSDKECNDRIYDEIWTGRWWHVLQSKVDEKRGKSGATVCPVIIATDKTQLTQFIGGQAAYPVYLTIGNIPKATRRKPSTSATILIAYLSVDKVPPKGLTKQALRDRTHRVFHQAMYIIFKSLIKAGNKGVEMVSSDGSVRDVFPLLSCYVADYPEQCLISCTKYGTCPKCNAKADQLGDEKPGAARTASWTLGVIQSADAETDGLPSRQKSAQFHKRCSAQGVSGTVLDPFWRKFPFCNIHQTITPDVLHQLYQGVFKHLVSWCQKALSDELDERISMLPPSYGVRHFKHGFSVLSQISGTERKNMAKILLGCLVGIMPKKGIQAVSALLDFIQIAQYESHSNDTLQYLRDALDKFHKHRSYFIDIGVRKHFNIPKFHSLLHYVESIELFGTTDNYNTEMFERLHIDYAKNGFRASNKRDVFPQMISYLTRQETVAYLAARQATDAANLTKENSNLVTRTTEKDDRLNSSTSILTGVLPPAAASVALIVDPNVLIEEILRSPQEPGPDLNQPASNLKELEPTPILNVTQPGNDKDILRSTISISKHPAYRNSKISVIKAQHCSPDFEHALKVYINERLEPSDRFSTSRLEGVDLPISIVDVYNLFRLHPTALHDRETDQDIIKALRKSPVHPNGQFDTVICVVNEDAESTGLTGTRVGRVRVIFSFPEQLRTPSGLRDRPKSWHSGALAYVEWYAPIPRTVEESHGGMYIIQSARKSVRGRVPGAIIPLSDIRQACMLIPYYGSEQPPDGCTPETALDMSSRFLLNNYRNKYAFQTIW